jgi:hypothetical protein
MYDHIERGWFAIAFTALGFMSAGLILSLFMLGERPLGLWFFRNRTQAPSEETPREESVTIASA